MFFFHLKSFFYKFPPQVLFLFCVGNILTNSEVLWEGTEAGGCRDGLGKKRVKGKWKMGKGKWGDQFRNKKKVDKRLPSTFDSQIFFPFTVLLIFFPHFPTEIPALGNPISCCHVFVGIGFVLVQ